MSGPKRNADSLNTIGVVVVGICGAVMVYVTIVALQAFYMNDTSEIQTMADYGGQDVTAKSHRADEMRNITEPATNGAAPGTPQTYRMRIDGPGGAMELIARDAAKAAADKKPADHLIPALPPSVKTTVKPIFGKGQTLDAPPAAPPTDGAGSGAGSAAGSGAGSAAGSGAANPTAIPPAMSGSGATGTGSGSPAAPAVTPPTAKNGQPANKDNKAGGHAP